MKQFLAIVGAVIAALACGGTGAYVLWQYHTTTGLGVGVGLILLSVAIALPVPFHLGVTAFRENAVLIVPVILGALKGGDRKTDPPKDIELPPPEKKP